MSAFPTRAFASVTARRSYSPAESGSSSPVRQFRCASLALMPWRRSLAAPTPEQYHVVYDGRIQDNDLEKLWNKFSRTPLGPDGQPLAISDVVELYNASGSTFFYIDRYGFQPIEFVDHPSQDQSMSMTL